MASNTEEDEFEDAFEDVQPKADTHKLSPVQNVDDITPRRPAELKVGDYNRTAPVNRLYRAPVSFFTPKPLNPIFVSPMMPCASASRDGLSHRERLFALRKRMNNEFGGREVTGSCLGSEGDDAMSTISEAASLHSWHRHMLSGPDNVHVHASDSVSTCAMSIPMRTPSKMSTTSCSPEVLPIDDLNRIRAATWNGSAEQISATHVPPPLPNRSDAVMSQKRVPPPLPPRNSIIRLPDPVSIEVENRLRCLEEEKENGSNHDINLTAEPISRTGNHFVRPRVSTKSNDSVPRNCDAQNGKGNGKKGHSKSNSLDRGLTLAKCLKAGPFPPPANKSNSLTRQGAAGEESERNIVAEGIIRQITTNLEASFQNINNEELLDPIMSAESSSISSPPSSAPSSCKKKDEDDEEQEAVKVDVVVQETPRTLEAPSKLKTKTSVRRSNDLPESFSATRLYSTKASKTNDREARSVSDDELNKHSHILSTSFDPIAQDVERRLSMKRDGTLPDDRSSLSLSDDGVSRFSLARSGIDHAKSLARNSVMYASGFFRGALRKVRTVTHTGGAKEIGNDTSDGEASESEALHHAAGIVRPRKAKKGPFDFEQLTVEQSLDNEHTGAVWCVRFSICGRLMATAGQDSILRIWVVRSHLKYFSEMREKYHATMGGTDLDHMSPLDNIDAFRPPSSLDSMVNSDSPGDSDETSKLFVSKPFAVLKGHTADILDLSWSKNYFILSSGMDRTVKLWHISRSECLCCFQHIDFVTCVAFLPKDDRYFLSGSLDGKLRLWHIPDKKVAVWNEVQVKFITAITFVKNGNFAVVGTYDGRCYFYTTDQLKYHTVVDIRSSRGRNAKGHKVTGLAVHGEKLLVTSNDSRIRMYDVRDKALTCKFAGVQNENSQIRASFSPDGRHIVCGSEDRFVYLWRASELPSTLSVRKDRNEMWERVRAHNAPVSVAVFAPRPQIFLSMLDKQERKLGNEPLDCDKNAPLTSVWSSGQVIVSADLQGSIKVMVNRPRQMKAGQSTFFSS